MITIDATTKSELVTARSLSGWSTLFNTAFAGAKRIRCYRNGTEFRNVGATGSFGLVGGNIDLSSLAVAGTTVSLAGDLTTGTCILRIEANGRWLQGTMGISGADFNVGQSFTATNGFGFIAGATLSGLQFLPPIPSAPSLDANAPYRIIHEDWTTGSAVDTGSMVLNNRIADLVAEDRNLAVNQGRVRVTQSTQSVIAGAGSYAFEFGVTMWSHHAGTNLDDPTKPVHKLLILAKPYGRWSSFPAMDTYAIATDSTFPRAFKIRIENASGTSLGKIEMRDALPINDPSLSQSRTGTAALRPFWHCASGLVWDSARQKLSPMALHYMPGLTADSVRPSQAKQAATSVAPVAQFAGRVQLNGLNQYFGMPLWPMSGASSNDALDTTADPYCYVASSQDDVAGTAGYRLRLTTGLGHEPGAIGGQDRICGPGGARFDRHSMSSVLSIYMTAPTGTRLKGGEANRDIVEHWRKNGYNDALFYPTNPKTFTSIPDAESRAGSWVYKGNYYGDSANPDSKSIDQRGIGNSGDSNAARLFDKDGLRPWGGSEHNSLHHYQNEGWWTLMFGCARDAYASKMRYNQQWMCSASESVPTANPRNYFMYRLGAWRFLPRVISWSIAADHALSMSRADLDIPAVVELEKIYDTIVAPATTPAHPNYNDFIIQSLRNLGTYAEEIEAYRPATTIRVSLASASTTIQVDDVDLFDAINTIDAKFNVYRIGTAAQYAAGTSASYTLVSKTIDATNVSVTGGKSGTMTFATAVSVPDGAAGITVRGRRIHFYQSGNGLGFYMSVVLMLAKQTGYWDAMRAKSAKCAAALDFYLQCLNKYSIDFMLDTDGRKEDYLTLDWQPIEDPLTIPANWAAWSTANPKVGQTDWIRDAAGAFREQDISMHGRPQHMYILKRFFPEVTYPRRDAAITMTDTYYADWAARVNALSPTDYTGRRNLDWTYRMPCWGIVLAPDTVGP